MNGIKEFVQETKNKGMVLGLDTMRTLAERLGNPQNKPKHIIHIAGTNGKGSVGAFIESALICSGHTVGRYTSPAVFSHLEVFRKNGKSICKDEYNRLMKTVMDTGIVPTEFEAETALAFLFVSGCDYAVIETGLGGLEDATNIITVPKTAVITSISLDHMRFLGGTIEEIAAQKCGIFNENTTVISAVQTEAARRIIAQKARRLQLSSAKKTENIRAFDNYQLFDYGAMKDVKIRLMGEFQTDNAAAAIETLLSLGINENDIRSGLESAQWHGRFEIISKEPIVIIDGAHNRSAFYELKKSLIKYYPDSKFNFITGVLKDKEYNIAAELFAPLAQSVYTITPPNPRALDKSEYAEEFKRHGVNAVPVETDNLKSVLRSGCVNVIFGSLSFMAQIKDVFQSYLQNHQ